MSLVTNSGAPGMARSSCTRTPSMSVSQQSIGLRSVMGRILSGRYAVPPGRSRTARRRGGCGPVRGGRDAGGVRSQPVRFTVGTPLPCGPVDVTVTDVGIARVSFFGPRDRPTMDSPAVADDPRVGRVRQALADYFAGRTGGLDLPVDWRHTS